MNKSLVKPTSFGILSQAGTDRANDAQMRPWVYVASNGMPLGWVFREYIVCKPYIRAGSGNLNNLDKWKFCLNAA